MRQNKTRSFKTTSMGNLESTEAKYRSVKKRSSLVSSSRFSLMLTGTEAARLLRKHLKNKEAREHSVVVAKIMEELAVRLKMNPEDWQLCGLLHDLDHEEIQGDMSKHGLMAAELLEGHLSKECLQAIRAHDHRAGIPPRSIVDKALIASDAVTRFLSELKDREADKMPRLNSETYQRKSEEKALRKVRYLRERIEMCREIGVTLDDFLSLAQDAFEKKDVSPDKSNLDGKRS